ncbi:unnamed protein product, partial [Prorocentrum cordatum]
EKMASRRSQALSKMRRSQTWGFGEAPNMNVIDVDDEEEKQNPAPAPPAASSSPPLVPSGAVASAASDGRPLPHTPTAAEWKAELAGDLSRRLDRIDGKLDWLIARAKPTGAPLYELPGAAAALARGGLAGGSGSGSGRASYRTQVTTETIGSGGGGSCAPGCQRPSDARERPSAEPSAGAGLAAPRLPSQISHMTQETCSESSVALSAATVTRIPNLSRRPGDRRRSARQSAWTASARTKTGSKLNLLPDVFRNNFFARKLYEKSDSKDLDNLQRRVNALPKAMRSQRNKTVDYVFSLLDDPSSSSAAWWTAACLQALVLCSVLGTLLQAVEDPPLRGWSGAVVETAFDVVFLTEVCVRWCCAPDRVNFLFIVQSWIDIVAASAFAVRAAVGFVLPERQDDPTSILLLCFVPIVRLLKIVRHFETFNVLIRAVQITMEALPMLLYAVALITMTFAALIYVVEPELFESPFRAVWFCLVTVTTVGYGDYSPVTPVGITIVMCLIIVGVILLAVPMGIIGMTFNDVWNARDYSLLLTKTRMKLHQWGYTAHDIPTLFKIVDSDGNGVLELDEFCELVKEMKIGLSDNRIIALFEHMDKDGSGALDAAEFALEVFPETFVDAYGHEDNSIVNKPKASTSWMASLAATINRGTNFQRPTND